MSRPFVFEKPIGFQDILPDLLRKKRLIEHRLYQCMLQWGYEEIETPSVEFFDTVGDASTTQESKLFKMLDQQGRTLILRPEMTTPIARVAASLLKDHPLPLRLMYRGNVFRSPIREAGKSAEFTQMGVELIGDDSLDGDAEVVAIAVEMLKQTQISIFSVAMSHIRFLEGYFEEWVNDKDMEEELRGTLFDRDYVRFRSIIKESGLSQKAKEALLAILRFRGGFEVLEQAKRTTNGPLAIQALEELMTIFHILSNYGIEDQVIFDLTMIARQNYYTGILFEGYADGLGSPVLSGGRYDQLIGQFGRTASATGFAMKVDRILEVSPLAPPPTNKVLILYDEDTRSKAYALAKEKREMGYPVVTLFDQGDAPLDRSGYLEIVDVRGVIDAR